MLDLGERTAKVDGSFYDSVAENDQVSLRLTPIFGDVEELHSLTDDKLRHNRPSGERVGRLAAAVVFLVPLTLFLFMPAADDPTRNMMIYTLFVIPSYIISLVAGSLWIKLLMTSAGVA